VEKKNKTEFLGERSEAKRKAFLRESGNFFYQFYRKEGDHKRKMKIRKTRVLRTVALSENKRSLGSYAWVENVRRVWEDNQCLGGKSEVQDNGIPNRKDTRGGWNEDAKNN